MGINNKTSNRGGYFEELDIAKGFAIILVVLGHSFPDTETGWNIIGKESFAQSLFAWIYSFHMPLFFLLSGFLFIPRLNRLDIKTNLKKRFKRLMIPYFFFSLIYIGFKTVGASFANHPLSEDAFVDMLLGVSPAGGCWFLWVLFMMCVVSVFARKLGPYGLFALSVLMYVLFIMDNSWMIGKIERVFHDYIWFAIGGVMANFYIKIKDLLNHVIVGVIAFLLLTALLFLTPCWWINLLQNLSGIIMSISLGCKIAEMGESWLRKSSLTLGQYCMDIYIISMLIVIPMRIIYMNFGASNYIPYYLYVVIATCSGCVIPLIVSKYFIRKNKILKTLILGS